MPTSDADLDVKMPRVIDAWSVSDLSSLRLSVLATFIFSAPDFAFKASSGGGQSWKYS